MISVTVVARRRRKILFIIQGLGVDAGLVLVVLIVWDVVALHVVRISVTRSAGLCDVCGKDLRKRVIDGSYSVIAVTTDTGRNVGIAVLQALAVHAGLVFALLIHAQARIERLHELGVAMTPSAERRYLRRLWFADEPFASIHGRGHIVLRSITAMTIDAREASGVVHVPFAPLYRFCERTVHPGMTFNARVFLVAVSDDADCRLLRGRGTKPQECDHADQRNQLIKTKWRTRIGRRAVCELHRLSLHQLMNPTIVNATKKKEWVVGG